VNNKQEQNSPVHSLVLSRADNDVTDKYSNDFFTMPLANHLIVAPGQTTATTKRLKDGYKPYWMTDWILRTY